jgi:hypothetical protein
VRGLFSFLVTRPPDKAKHDGCEQYHKEQRRRADPEDQQRAGNNDEQRDRHQFAPQEPGKVRVAMVGLLVIGGGLGRMAVGHAVGSFLMSRPLLHRSSIARRTPAGSRQWAAIGDTARLQKSVADEWELGYGRNRVRGGDEMTKGDRRTSGP